MEYKLPGIDRLDNLDFSAFRPVFSAPGNNPSA